MAMPDSGGGAGTGTWAPVPAAGGCLGLLILPQDPSPHSTQRGLPPGTMPARVATRTDTAETPSLGATAAVPVLSPRRAPALILLSMSSHMSARSPLYRVAMKPSTSLTCFRYIVPVSPLLRLIQFLESIPSPRWKTWVWGVGKGMLSTPGTPGEGGGPGTAHRPPHPRRCGSRWSAGASRSPATRCA